jgi:murein DD-endopeptidase MepM/ murein hydrolase activator NlpD
LTTALLNESIGQTSIDLALPRMVVPFTAKPEEPKLEVTVYNVQVGDTVFGIAQKLGLRPETLQWSNPAIERNPDLLSVGDQLKVPPIDGAMHTVRTGDTLLAIAQRYKVKPETLFSFPANQLKDLSSELLVGQQLFIPGGEKPLERPAISGAAVTSATRSQAPWNAARGSGSFVWPAAGDISQKYWSGHRGIDISSWTGNPVVSADSGYVVEVGGGWSGGYGLHVIVDHGNGYHTLYAHLSSVWVKGGENVTQGQAVGAVGSTGNSTGPHLHFEVRYNGIPQNPFSYLR